MTEHTHTVVVTIGRDTDDGPMRPAEWSAFKLSVLDAMERAGCTILQRPGLCSKSDQIGIWEGQTEEAAAFVALFNPHAWVGDDQAELALRTELAALCHEYRQDAIGMMVASGTANLVTGADG